MSKIVLDDALKARLNGLNEELELCDPQGATLGRFMPEAEYQKLQYALAEAACPTDRAELERRRTEPGRTLDEIWQRLGAK
jgi:hypothetical protein